MLVLRSQYRLMHNSALTSIDKASMTSLSRIGSDPTRRGVVRGLVTNVQTSERDRTIFFNAETNLDITEGTGPSTPLTTLEL
jgi:hypothetical protein